MKPLLKEIPYKVKSMPFNIGGGVNQSLPPFDLHDNEATDCNNVDSKKFPAINVRAGRSQHSSIAGVPRMLGQRENNEILVVDGTTLKYWNGTSYVTLKTGLSAEWGKVEDFVTGQATFSIFSNGIERYKIDGTTVTALGQFPTSRLFTVHKGRAYALYKNELHYSALNDPTDFYTTGETGAGTIVVTNAKGDSTAVVGFGNHVVIFSYYSMHELWGSGPDYYELRDISYEIGCWAIRAIKEIKGVLYWYGRGNIFAYDGGGLPIPVGDNVKDYLARATSGYYHKAVAGSDGQRYYLSIAIDGATENNITLVYDTKEGTWYPENGGFADFTELNNDLYGVTISGKIVKINSTSTDDNGTPIAWYVTSKPFNEGNLSEKKNWKNINLIVDCPVGSTLYVSLSTDAEGDNFTTVKSIPANANIQSQEITIPLNIAQNANYVRLNFNGIGPCTIHEIERQLRVVKRW